MNKNHDDMKSKTLDYYNKNAAVFIEGTRSTSMSETLQIFLKYIPPQGRVLDFGCGSGRDTRYFLEHGYQVDAIDGSEELCRAASLYTGIKVKNLEFKKFNELQKYDGIWACASILHLTYEELSSVFDKIADGLKIGGVLYVSFKYGTFEGDRNGRYFTDMTEIKMKDILEQVPRFLVMKQWVTADIRKEREDEQWLNLILKKID